MDNDEGVEGKTAAVSEEDDVRALEPLDIIYNDKNLITECTAQEFRNWMLVNGLNIDFISDRTLDAEDIEFRHRIRRAFILDLRAKKEAEN